MPGRRVIVHAGFHKTGTSSAQSFLRANRKHITPHCALVLPGRLRKGAARMATRYAQFTTSGLLDQFADELHSALSDIDVRNRTVLISDENLAGRMPGREGHLDYGATPTLMARAEDVICDIFGAEADVVFHFTTRNPDSWLRSTYKHNLRTSRLTQGEAEYKTSHATAANLDAIVHQVADAVTGTVYTITLEDLIAAQDSPARPLIDLMELPPQLRSQLKPQDARNQGPPDRLIPDLLALNRSNLSDSALEVAKADLIANHGANG